MHICMFVCIDAWLGGPKSQASAFLLENNVSPGNDWLSTSIIYHTGLSLGHVRIYIYIYIIVSQSRGNIYIYINCVGHVGIMYYEM